MKAEALALTLIAAVTLSQQAAGVSLSTDGRGQVLLFPYYTVQGTYDTAITLINASGAGKAVKLRFREGRNGRPVLDLNLYLSGRDAWAAAITEDSAGEPILRVFDTSCTVPTLAASDSAPGAREIAFSNAAYANYDRAGSGLDRAREGYLEVLEMGVINPDFNLPTGSGSIPFGEAVIHGSSGVPLNCAAVAAGWGAGGAFLTSNGAELTPPTGGLMGSGTLISVTQGTDYSYEPTALAAVFGNKSHTAPGSVSPSLNDAIGSSLVVLEDVAMRSTWANGVDAMSALLMHNSMFNEYFTAPELNAATDLVLTFPTKPFYVALESNTGSATLPPFTVRFDDLAPVGPGATGPLLDDGTSSGACEPVDITRYSRNGGLNSPPDFESPLPPEPGALCWTANIITLGNVLDSVNAVAIDSHPLSRDGWIRVSFGFSGRTLISGEGHQFIGLPVIGFAVHKYVNGNVGGVLSNYGGAFGHKYETVIQ
jgi:hypothetical protein